MARGATLTVYTTLDAYETSSVIRSALDGSTRGVQYHRVNDGQPIAEFATGKDGGLIKKQWGVQFEIYNEGNRRRVILGVERSSHREMAAAAFGARNVWDRADALGNVSFDEKLGKEKMELVLERLKKADPRLSVN